MANVATRDAAPVARRGEGGERLPLRVVDPAMERVVPERAPGGWRLAVAAAVVLVIGAGLTAARHGPELPARLAETPSPVAPAARATRAGTRERRPWET